MASLNRVDLIGNLTRNPEVRYTPKGTAVADICLAINRKYSTEGGDSREEVTYVDVIVWSRLAELAGQYLVKGSPVYIEGRLQLDSWDDKATGQKRTKLRVVGENLQFLGRRPSDGAESEPRTSSAGRPSEGQRRPGQQQPPPRRPPAGDPGPDAPITDGMDDDDIPF